MKSKCPHPGQRDLRDPPARSRTETQRPKRRHQHRKRKGRALEPSTSNPPEHVEELPLARGDIERELPSDVEEGRHDVERD